MGDHKQLLSLDIETDDYLHHVNLENSHSLEEQNNNNNDDDIDINTATSTSYFKKQNDILLNKLNYTYLTVAAAFIVIIVLVIVLIMKPNINTTSTPVIPVDSSLISYFNSVNFAINTKIDPCDDFYEYSCGNWLDTTTIPSDKGGIERSFTTISDNNLAVAMQITADRWPIMGEFYASCMDTNTRNSIGIAPLAPYVNLINNFTLETDASLAKSKLATMVYNFSTSLSSSLFFSYGVVGNASSPTEHCFYLSQDGGTSLPSADYYSSVNITQSFIAHVTNMFTLAGFDYIKASTMANSVYNFEFKLSTAQLPPDQMRDPIKTYNPTKVSDLIIKSPNFDWISLFSVFPVSIDEVVLDNPAYFVSLSTILSDVPADTLKAYTYYRMLKATSGALTSAISAESFAFYSVNLRGVKVPPPLNQTCTNLIDSNLGDLLGRVWVERMFSGNSLTLAQQLIANVKVGFAERLRSLNWLDDTTRTAALYKLYNITDLIGYSDNWDMYTGLNPKSDEFFNNRVQINNYLTLEKFSELSKSVDKTKWEMTAPTVNAYYDPSLNSINFPAGILQPPFFSSSFPTAANYGGIGMVIGHELMHGFDDQGANYDPNGKLSNWWTPNVKSAFDAKADCLIGQYSQYQVNGLNVNGNLTLGENIADNGGVVIAWAGYKLKTPDSSWSSISSITPDQLFFLSFAQGWCSKRTAELSKEYLKTDPHSPPKYRVNGALSNFQDFSATFSCRAGSRMNPSNKCLLW